MSTRRRFLTPGVPLSRPAVDPRNLSGALSGTFGDYSQQLDQEDRAAAAQERAYAVESRRQQAEQERAAKEQADAAEKARKEQAKVQKRAAEAYYTTRGTQTLEDDAGNVMPRMEAGKPVRSDVSPIGQNAAPVQWDKSGRAYQVTREQGKTAVHLTDAKVPIGPNKEDPNDPAIYRQNKQSPWEHIDPEAGLSSPDSAVSRAAAGHLKQKKLAELEKQAALLKADEELPLDPLDLDAKDKLAAKKRERIALDKQVIELKAQDEATFGQNYRREKSADPAYQKKAVSTAQDTATRMKLRGDELAAEKAALEKEQAAFAEETKSGFPSGRMVEFKTRQADLENRQEILRARDELHQQESQRFQEWQQKEEADKRDQEALRRAGEAPVMDTPEKIGAQPEQGADVPLSPRAQKLVENLKGSYAEKPEVATRWIREAVAAKEITPEEARIIAKQQRISASAPKVTTRSLAGEGLGNAVEIDPKDLGKDMLRDLNVAGSDIYLPVTEGDAPAVREQGKRTLDQVRLETDSLNAHIAAAQDKVEQRYKEQQQSALYVESVRAGTASSGKDPLQGPLTAKDMETAEARTMHAVQDADKELRPLVERRDKSLMDLRDMMHKGAVPVNEVVDAYRKAGRVIKGVPSFESWMAKAGGDVDSQSSDVQKKRLKLLKDYVAEYSDQPLFKPDELNRRYGEAMQRITEEVNREAPWYSRYGRATANTVNATLQSYNQMNALFNKFTGDTEDMRTDVQDAESYGKMLEISGQVGGGKDRWSGAWWLRTTMNVVPSVVETVAFASGGAMLGSVVPVAGTTAGGVGSLITSVFARGAMKRLIAQQMVKMGGKAMAEKAATRMVVGALLKENGKGAMTNLLRQQVKASFGKWGAFTGSFRGNAGEYLNQNIGHLSADDWEKNPEKIDRAAVLAFTFGVPAAALDMLDGVESGLIGKVLGTSAKTIRNKATNAAAAWVKGVAGGVSREFATGMGQGVFGVIQHRMFNDLESGKSALQSLENLAANGFTGAEQHEIWENALGEAVGGGMMHGAGQTAARVRSLKQRYDLSRENRRYTVQASRVESAVGNGEGFDGRLLRENVARLEEDYQAAIKSGDWQNAKEIRQVQSLMQEARAGVAAEHSAAAAEAAAQVEAARTGAAQQAQQAQATGADPEVITQIQQAPDAASAVLKIQSGAALDDLTQAELTAVGYERGQGGTVAPVKGADGVPGIYEGPDGSPIVSDALAEQAAVVAPAIADMHTPEVKQITAAKIRASRKPRVPKPGKAEEAPAATSSAGQTAPAPLDSSAPPMATAPDGLSTWEVSVDGKAEPVTVQAATRDDAVRMVAEQGEGMVRGAERISGPVAQAAPAAQEAPSPEQETSTGAGPQLGNSAPVPVEPAGRTDTRTELERRGVTPENAAAIAKGINEAWSVLGDVFTGGIKYSENRGAGLGTDIKNGKPVLELSLNGLAESARVATDPEAWGREAVLEEAIHGISLILEKAGKLDVVKIWKNLPEKTKAYVIGVRGAESDRNLGHEFLRMVMQNRVAVKAGKLVVRDAAGKAVITESFAPEKMKAVLDAVRAILAYLRDMVGALKKDGASAATVKLIKSKVAEMEALLQEMTGQKIEAQTSTQKNPGQTQTSAENTPPAEKAPATTEADAPKPKSVYPGPSEIAGFVKTWMVERERLSRDPGNTVLRDRKGRDMASLQWRTKDGKKWFRVGVYTSNGSFFYPDEVRSPGEWIDAFSDGVEQHLARELAAAVAVVKGEHLRELAGLPTPEAKSPAAPKAPEWQAFAPETGTLGIPRADMPQIKAEHRGALANFLEARGIKWQRVTVNPDRLRPTQAEFSPAKVQKALDFDQPNRAILVAADGYIVDGHHQWLAAKKKGEPMEVIRLSGDIRKVLAAVKEFPSAETAPAETAGQPEGFRPITEADLQPDLIGKEIIASPGLKPVVVSMYDKRQKWVKAGGQTFNFPGSILVKWKSAPSIPPGKYPTLTVSPWPELMGPPPGSTSEDIISALKRRLAQAGPTLNTIGHATGTWFELTNNNDGTATISHNFTGIKVTAEIKNLSNILDAAPTQSGDPLRDLILSPDNRMKKAVAMKRLSVERGETMKQTQEAVEAKLVQVAHEIAQSAQAPIVIFEQLVDLYGKQPLFSSRTSTSIANQAYSTPAPMAFALGHMTGVTPKTPVYDATGGNGMLFIGADIGNSVANEIDATRRNGLKQLGIGTVTDQDATKPGVFKGKRVPIVHLNPPFGGIPNVNFDGYGIRKLEHIISLHGLGEAMADNGTAAIILGANMENKEQVRGAQWIFENYLYGNYNVVDNFEVSGDLYANQGAKWPVRILVIAGRRETPVKADLAPKTVDRLNTWSDVWSRASRTRDEVEQQRSRLGSKGPSEVSGDTQDESARPDQPGAVPPGERAPSGKTPAGGKPRGGRGGKPDSGKSSGAGGPGMAPEGSPPQQPDATTADGSSKSGGGKSPRVDQGGRGNAASGTDAPAGGGKRSGATDTSGQGKPDAPAVSDALQAALQQMRDAAAGLVDGLMSRDLSDSGPDYSRNIPPDRIPKFVAAAQSMIAAGVNSPNGMAWALDQINPALRQFSKSIWAAFLMVDNTLPSDVDWNAIYKAIDKKPELTPPAPKPRAKAESTDTQVPYDPESTGAPFETLIPRGISEAVRSALEEITANRGQIDEFVADSLDMSVADLHKAMSAEQIDGVAMAIYQMETGGALVIGDETGIGKGRQAASLIRYAVRKGKIPVFFTKDPKLFSDMWGDLKDIGTTVTGPNVSAADMTVRPLVLGDSAKAKVVTPDGDVILTPSDNKQQRTIFNGAKRDGFESQGYNAIWATYSQIRDPNERQSFLEWLASENDVVVILDEAHEAAGDGETSMQAAFMMGGTVKRGSGANKVEIEKSGLLNSRGAMHPRGGVLYLSATFAKRPDNMPVYFRTDLRRSADSFPQVVSAMQKGGVALQQAVTEALAEAGQYSRRERDFTGISYTMKRAQVADEAALIKQVDQVTSVLSQIARFSRIIRSKVADSTAMSGNQMAMTEFASIVHNQVSQLLLAAKADAVVDEVVAAHRRGEKPIVGLMNTMESFLKQYTADLDIKPGQEISLNWNALLEYALSRTLRVSEKLPNGDTAISTIDPAEYNLDGMYNAVRDAAREIEVSFPVSPIDYIIQKAKKAGVNMGELTGRESGIEYVDFQTGQGIYRRFKKADKNRLVNGFNSGEIGGLLLNASGATGLSIHASEKFKDQKPRHMIIAQPPLDINVFIQMLGRIKRTGIVLMGRNPDGSAYGARYSHLTLPLNAELRPAVMAARKMKSLNANTTGESDSAVKIEAEDLMNRFGNQAVAEYLNRNPELASALDITVEEQEDGTVIAPIEVARRFTGRMALTPDAFQGRAYSEITQDFRRAIEQAKATGDYDLEIIVHDDWDGERKSSEQITKGTDESSIFTASVNAERWEITDNRPTPSGADMLAEFKKESGSAEQVAQRWSEFAAEADRKLEGARKHYQTKLAEARAKEDAQPLVNGLKDVTESARYERLLAGLETKVLKWEETKKRLDDILDFAGEPVALTTEDGEEHAMMTEVKFPDLSKSLRLSPSAFRFAYLLNRPGGRVFPTLAQFKADGGYLQSINRTALEDISGHSGGRRETRIIMTGNPIRAFAATGERGKVVRFKARDGAIITGLMMPRNWKVTDLTEDPRAELSGPDAVQKYVTAIGTGFVSSGDGVRINFTPWDLRVSAPSAKRTGGAIFLDPELRELTGDFVKNGARMTARVYNRDDLAKIAERIVQITRKRFRGENLAEVRRANGIGDAEPESPTASKSKAKSAAKESATRQWNDRIENGPSESLRARPFDDMLADAKFIMPDGALLTGAQTHTLAARAFHGTPHKVDRFSLDKIGTGEGAQAYGWGLYFAEDRGVGEYYQRALADSALYFKGRPLLKNGRMVGSLGDAELNEWFYHGSESYDPEESAQSAEVDGRPDIAAKIRALIPDITKGEPGNLYTVELLPDADEWLDWDKPLSEQSEKVKAALSGLPEWRAAAEFQKERPEQPEQAGVFYFELSKQFSEPKAASEKLASLGIPGIRYLDGNSRDGGSGTYNYVIFDDKLVKILEENGKPVDQALAARPFDDLVSEAVDARTQAAAVFGPEAEAINADLDALVTAVARGESVGNPSRAYSMADAQMRAVDQYREETITPETHEQWKRGAEALLAQHGPEKAMRMVMAKGQRGDVLSPEETYLAKMLLVQSGRNLKTAADVERARAFRFAYRQTGAEAARSLAARVDDVMTPAERMRAYLQGLAFDPSAAAKKQAAKKREAAKDAPPEEAAKLRETARNIENESSKQQLAKLQKDLAKSGFTLDEWLNTDVLIVQDAPIFERLMRELGGWKADAVRAMQGGDAPFKLIARQTGKTEKEVGAVRKEFEARFAAWARSQWKPGMTADDLLKLRSEMLGTAPLGRLTNAGESATLGNDSRAVSRTQNKDVKRSDLSEGRPTDSLFEASEVSRGDGQTNESERGVPGYERQTNQERRFVDWAKSTGLPKWSPAKDLRQFQGGAEHAVWRGDGVIWKQTINDSFGWVPGVTREGWGLFPGMPADYLEGLALRNAVFGQVVELAGYQEGKFSASIVTRQPFIAAASPERPHPSVGQIRSYMEARGFQFFESAYYHPEYDVVVADTKPSNFILSRSGPVLIDGVIAKPTDGLRAYIHARLSSQALSSRALASSDLSGDSFESVLKEAMMKMGLVPPDKQGKAKVVTRRGERKPLEPDEAAKALLSRWSKPITKKEPGKVTELTRDYFRGRDASDATKDALRNDLVAAGVDADIAEKVSEEAAKKLKASLAGPKVKHMVYVDMADAESVIVAAKAMGASRGDAIDRLQEYWYFSQLSGLTTQTANVTGYPIHLFHMATTRTLGGLMNSALGLVGADNALAPKLGDLGVMWKAALPGIADAWRLALKSYQHGVDFLAYDKLHDKLHSEASAEEIEKLLHSLGMEAPARAWKGVAGKIIHSPFTALQFVDVFGKTLIAHMEAASHAYRIAKQEQKAAGTTGEDDLVRRMQILLNTPGSDAWRYAIAEAVEAGFQTPLKGKGSPEATNSMDRIERAIAGLFGKIDEALSTKDSEGAGKLLKVILKMNVLPYVKTPYNIVRIGLRRSPYGAAFFAFRALEAGIMHLSGKKGFTEVFGKFHQHLAEQLLAWGAYIMLSGLVEGDDDDDEKRLLLVGGPLPGAYDREENMMRTVRYGGDYVLRIGDRETGKPLPYGRLEPIATALGSTVDLIRTAKMDAGNWEKSKRVLSHFMAQTEQKTFLQGVAGLLGVIDDLRGGASNEDKIKRMGMRTLSAIVPNIVKSSVRNADPVVREYSTSEDWYPFFPSADGAEPRITPAGQEIKKGGNAAGRIFFMPANDTSAPMEPWQKVVSTYNARRPSVPFDEGGTWAPSAPDRTITIRGQDVTLNAEAYRDYSRLSGEIAGKMLKSIKPEATKENVERIRRGFEEARKAARAQIAKRPLAEIQAAP